MHKNRINKFLIIALMSLLITGCDKKSTELVLTEPVQIVNEGEAGVADNDEANQGASDKAPSDKALSEDKASKEEKEALADKAADLKDDASHVPDTVMVYVCGAVLCEGVYELPSGSRVVDAIKAAGGFMQDADTEFVNQALVLEDGVKIKIPTVEESLKAKGSEPDTEAITGSDSAGISGMTSDASATSEGSKVNINTASEAELCTIPGIGPGRAKNIIAYREENGKFGTIDDIMKVSGIKDKFFSKIKDHITV